MRDALRSRLAIVVLVVAHVLALGAPLIAPYDPSAQDRFHVYAPPTRIHFFDTNGWHLRPRVYALKFVDFNVYAEDPATSYPVHFFCRGPSGFTASSGFRLFCVDAPARVLLLGTDGFGRDQFSRLVYGARISLGAGILATALALCLGLVIGLASGYFGGWVDECLMGSSELLLTLPWLYLLIAFRAFLPLHVEPANAFLMIVSVVALLGWTRPARLVRGIALTAKTSNYVLAARGMGGSHSYVIRRHVLPVALSVLLTQAALLIPQFVAAEVSLSFFGLGVGEPVASWGNMLATLQQYQVLVSYWWMLAPAAALLLVSMSYCVLADAVDLRLQGSRA